MQTLSLNVSYRHPPSYSCYKGGNDLRTKQFVHQEVGVSLLEPPVDPRGTAARGTFNGTEAEVELQPQPSTVAGDTTVLC